MTGEIERFKSRLFGGFCKKDVVTYIEKLAKERNELEKARDSAEQSAQRLAGEVALLRREMDDYRRVAGEYQSKTGAMLRAAGAAHADTESDINALRVEMEAAAEIIAKNLAAAEETLSKSQPILAAAGERFRKLRAEYSEDGDIYAIAEAADGIGGQNGDSSVDERDIHASAESMDGQINDGVNVA